MRTSNARFFSTSIASAFVLVTLVTDYGTQNVNLPAKPIAVMRLGDGALFISFKNRAPLVYKGGRLQGLNLRKF